MSASKIGQSNPFKPVTVKSQTNVLDLSADAVQIRKNGIEFRMMDPIPIWTEMTVKLDTPFEDKSFEANGVVVACNGNRHTGFVVSIMFTDLSLPEKARLQLLALSSLA